MHQRGGIELAVFKAFREVLVEALSFGLGVAELVLVHLLAVLLVVEALGQFPNGIAKTWLGKAW